MGLSLGSIFSSTKQTATSLAKNAKTAANSLTSAENSYISALKSGDQGAIAAAEVKYRNQQINFEGLMQMIKNRFDTIMRSIRNMSLG